MADRLTFIDSGVLIAAARGTDELARRAIEVLDDPDRTFASSVFVRLEVLPKPLYNQRREEAEFYLAFSDGVAVWAEPLDLLASRALDEAVAAGLSALDALHVAGAVIVGADELVTIERLSKPIHLVTSVPVVTIHPDPS
jgi:predicted nucleic acid-binding protein